MRISLQYLKYWFFFSSHCGSTACPAYFLRKHPTWIASYPSLSLVLIWVTIQSFKSITVTGTTVFFAENTCVIPIFVPQTPFNIENLSATNKFLHQPRMKYLI